MIEETATSGSYDCTDEIPVTISHGSFRRSRRDTDDTGVSISGSRKRRRFGCEDEEDDLRNENVVTTAVSINSSVVNGDSMSDLKVECFSETDIFNSDGFSRETWSTSSVVCLESEEMESSSTSMLKKTTEIEATSRRKQPPAAEKMPSAAELEEFFSNAEKYEEKRFAEKYNFDIVKDVPMEGRYQWVPLPLKP